MFKVCLYVINTLLLNWGLEGRSVRTPGWQHGVCHFPFAMLATSLEYRVWSFWFGVWGLEFRVWGLEFRVWGLEFRVWGLEFRVWSLGFGV